ncbi:Arylsulfatase [Rubripirellula amarantea]|uniref:Arylsulfatase n=1 Tax=Rubripirellula amarantea TaxID=2527999 RepID=A0A5C5WKA5_9BACT|nr:sulfatase-like hydrolase/transferase [Rubripirellula amarantea]TWT51080.1 Arylsulfatase [Rubripirellula amarantea]
MNSILPSCRRLHSKVLWVIGLVTFLGLAELPTVQGQTRPNVLLILTDDHGALDAGCYGSDDLKTPNIDRVAREGVRFTNAFAHTVCCPARAMLMTGRHPQRGDVGSWTQGGNSPQPTGRNLLLSETTIAEAFQRAGYATALFGKWHLGGAQTHGPSRQGFDEFFGIRGGFIDNYNHYGLHGKGHHDLFEKTTEVWREGEYFMDMVTDRSIEFVRSHQAEPFFLYYPMNLPHYPEQSIEPYASDFADLDPARQSYARILASTDHYIGRMLDALDELKLANNTIVVIAGDNGYSSEDYQITVDGHASGHPKGFNYGPNAGGGNTGKWRGSKGSFLEGGLRVPMLVRYPGTIPAGEVRDQTITLMDWFPTVAGYAGVDTSEIEFDGQDLRPVIAKDAASNHYETMHWHWQNSWTVRQGDWKLIVNGTTGLNGGGKNRIDNTLPAVFLGNLSDDAPEQVNHADSRPEIVAKFTAMHAQWASDVAPPPAEAWQEK